MRILKLYRDKKESKFLDFLIKQQAIDKLKINHSFDGYNHSEKGVINLSKEKIEKNNSSNLKSGLYYGNIFQDV